jgi:hypothetical protein
MGILATTRIPTTTGYINDDKNAKTLYAQSMLLQNLLDLRAFRGDSLHVASHVFDQGFQGADFFVCKTSVCFSIVL